MASHTENFTIEDSLPGGRLDVFLRGKFPAVSRGALQRLIEQSHVRVNGKTVKPTHSPRAGERIEIHWPEARPAEAQPEEMPLDILFEDKSLLVLNKPAGLVVHPAAGHEEHTLVNALLHHCRGSLSGIGGVARPGIVHRLDKETSGCLVVAKNDAAHVALAEQFAGRTVEKIYHALVCGEMQRDAADAAQLAGAMVQQGVDERVLLVPGAGMHDDVRRLVEDEQVLVLEQNFQRDVLGLRGGGHGLRPVDFNLLAGVRMVRGLDGLAVDADVALFDEPPDGAARDGGKFFAQESVEPRVGLRLFDEEGFVARGHLEIANYKLRIANRQSAFCGGVSFFQFNRKISPTPTQMPLSARLKAGTPCSRPPVCTKK